MNEQLDIEIEALKAENFSLRLEIERLKRAQSGPPAWEYQLERADNLDRKLTTATGRLRRERARTKDLEAQLAAVRPEVKAIGDAVLDAMALGVSFIRIAPEDVFAKPPSVRDAQQDDADHDGDAKRRDDPGGDPGARRE